MSSIIQKYLTMSPVIPVIVLHNIEDALPLAKALVKGNINIVEITLRTRPALDAISAIRQTIPEMIVGAGTVNSVDLIQKSVEAGSQLLVCPGVTKPLLDAAQYYDTPLLPGAITPSEAMQLFEQGYTHLKFFPAEAAGGTRMLKAMQGPLPDLKFCPTGGITEKNIDEYLSLENVICVGSSWVASEDLIANNNWQEITRRAKIASAIK